MPDEANVLDNDRDLDTAAASRTPLFHGIRAYVNQLRFGQAQSSIYHGRILYNQSYALAVDSDPLEVCMRDPVFRQCADTRIRSAVLANWSLVAGDKTTEAEKLASVCEDGVRQIVHMYAAMLKMASCILVGSSYTYVEGRRKQVTLGGIPGKWWCPRRLVDINYRRFRWAVEHDPKTGRPLVLLEMKRAAGYGDDWMLVPRAAPMIRIVYQDEEARLGSGRGLMDSVIQDLWAVQELKQLGHEGAALWARGGIAKAAIQGLTRSNSKATAQAIIDWQTAITAMLKDGTLIHDAADTFEVIPGGGEGANVVKGLIDMHYANIRGVMLNAQLPFGGGEEAGSLARAREEGDQAEAVFQNDRNFFAENLERDLVGLFIRINEPYLNALGFRDVARPKWSAQHDKREDATDFVSRVSAFLQIPDTRLSLKDTMERAGFPIPEAGEEVITGQAPAPPVGGGGAGGGYDGGFSSGFGAGAGADAQPQDESVGLDLGLHARGNGAAHGNGRARPMLARAAHASRPASLVAAGLAVLAADTGRVLMLQRALEEGDHAGGTWEFPGGHIDDGEGPLAAAKREWAEETGLELPAGKSGGSWRASNGVYKGFVHVVPAEAGVPIHDGREDATNPDDPDGDCVEAVAWFDPEHLRLNSAVRRELADDIGMVLRAIDAARATADEREKAAHRRWEERMHPRGDGGKFTAGAGGGAGAGTGTTATAGAAGDDSDVESLESTAPGAVPAPRTRLAEKAASKVGNALAALRDPKKAALAAAQAARAAHAKLSAPLREAGYSATAANAIAGVAAFIAVSPFSVSGTVAAAGGPAALLAVPGAAEAVAIVKGAVALRRPAAAIKSAVAAVRGIGAKLAARRQRLESQRGALESLMSEHAARAARGKNQGATKGDES